jgi:hypothetical protein
MKKFSATLTVLSISLAFGNCQKSDYRPVKQYTIEQFMNTTKIGGSS